MCVLGKYSVSGTDCEVRLDSLDFLGTAQLI